HGTARTIVHTINSRFPRSSGSRSDVAVGRNSEVIEINVPRERVGRTDEFFEILTHLRIRQSGSRESAARFAETLVEKPEIAEHMKWSLIAIGEVALEFVRPIYGNPQRVPRITALEVGAKLGDPLTRPHLEELSRPYSGPDRLRAVRLMAHLPADPAVDHILIGLLEDEDIAVRVEAYESLARRESPIVRQRIIGDKFVLHRVPVGTPMIYVTQQLVPRIAIFGENVRLNPNSLVMAWGNRLMIRTEPSVPVTSVFWRSEAGGSAKTEEIRADLNDFVEYLAHKTTPEAPAEGLDLSYGQVIGAVNELVVGGGMDAMFVPEANRLELQRLRALNATVGSTRPEFSEDGSVDAFSPIDPGSTLAAARDANLTDEEKAERERRRARYVVRLRDDPADAESEDPTEQEGSLIRRAPDTEADEDASDPAVQG
ncbi:MAG: HEAT repeat domain-containing protein, partial [Planctomycetota bacterium]